MTDKQKHIVEGIISLKKQLNVDKVILFGSRARGDYNSNSDWDILVLYDKFSGFTEDFDKYAVPFKKFGDSNNVDIDVHICTTDAWKSYQNELLLCYNINNEGVEL